MLRLLGFSVVPLHGDLSQSQRTGALSKFKSGERKVLVATDVASRGLDIPAVDLVLNYDMPLNLKDYIHRVGRATRAGRAGKAILFTTQYDVEFVQRLETALGKKLVEWETSKEDVVAMLGVVDEAGQVAAREVREEEGKRKKGRDKRKREDGGGGTGTAEVSYEGTEEVAMLKGRYGVKKRKS